MAAGVVERIQAAVRLLIVPYRVRGGLVEILHVFRGARRWPTEPAGW